MREIDVQARPALGVDVVLPDVYFSWLWKPPVEIRNGRGKHEVLLPSPKVQRNH